MGKAFVTMCSSLLSFSFFFLLVASRTCDAMVATRRVKTNLTLPEDGIRVLDTTQRERQACEMLGKRDALVVEQILTNGNGDWQEGEDLYIARENSGRQYAIIFLHGATEIIPEPPLQPPRVGPPCNSEQNVNAEIAMVEELLDELGGGVGFFPQALPKFSFDVACLSSEFEPLQCFNGSLEEEFNAICVPQSTQWLPPLDPHDIVDTCYSDVSIWSPFFNQYVSRIEEFVKVAHNELGIPLDRIFLLGFSQGAVMAQRALITLALNGLKLGGGIGFDGAEVEMMISKDMVEKLPPGMEPNILYFLYSSPQEAIARVASCLEDYPGLHVQVHSTRNDSERIQYHALFSEFVKPTKLWIQAENKTEAQKTVEEAWRRAIGAAFDRAEMYPCPGPD